MRKKTKKKLGPTKIFDKIENKAYVDTFDTSKASGFDISWSMKDVGFGHLTLVYDRESGEFRTDTECMSSKLIEKIIKLAAPELARKFLELDISKVKQE